MYSGIQRIVCNLHLMMLFIIWTQTSKNLQSFFFCRFIYCHRLETAFQSGIFLNIFTIFRNRSSTNDLYLTSRQRRFQDIGSVHGSLCSSGTDDRMQFINKKKNARMIHDLGNDLFDPFFKLSAVFASRYHTGQIQHQYPFARNRFRHCTLHDPLGQSLHNGCFAHTGFTDQAGIVFGPSAQDLNNTADLGLTTDHRIQFTGSGHTGQIAAVFVQHGCIPHAVFATVFHGLQFFFCLGNIHSHSGKSINIQLLHIYPHRKQKTGCHTVCFFDQSKKKMIRTHQFLVETLSFLHCIFQNILCPRRIFKSFLPAFFFVFTMNQLIQQFF